MKPLVEKGANNHKKGEIHNLGQRVKTKKIAKSNLLQLSSMGGGGGGGESKKKVSFF